MKIMRLRLVLAVLLVCFILLFGCINKKEQEAKSPSSPENNFNYPSAEEIEKANNDESSLMIVKEDETQVTFNNTPSNTGESLDLNEHGEMMPPLPPE